MKNKKRFLTRLRRWAAYRLVFWRVTVHVEVKKGDLTSFMNMSFDICTN